MDFVRTLMLAFAVADLRQSGRLGDADKVSLTWISRATEGNGVCRTFVDDNRVFIYDQYNLHIFPQDAAAQRRIDCKVTVPFGWGELDYLAALESHLPPFLNSVTQGGEI